MTEHDTDKIHTHVVLSRWTPVDHCRAFLIALASIVLLAVALRADDPVPDSTLPPFSPPIIKSEKPFGSGGRFSYGVSGLATVESDEISNGFGFGVSGFFNGFQPLVVRAGMDVVISKLDSENLPSTEFVIISPALDLTLRPATGRLRPYVSAGINAHFNHLYFDEPAAVSISGYDSTTQARQIDMGSGIAPHLRLGLVIPVGDKLSLLFESMFMSASHNADINYRDRLTGDEWKGTVDYTMPSVWFSLGIIRDP